MARYERHAITRVSKMKASDNGSRDAFAVSSILREFEHFLRAVSTTSVAVVRSGSNQSIPREESVIERRGCNHRPRRCFGGFEDGKRERSRVFEKSDAV